jgi:hypothetical protein
MYESVPDEPLSESIFSIPGQRVGSERLERPAPITYRSQRQRFDPGRVVLDFPDEDD